MLGWRRNLLRTSSESENPQPPIFWALIKRNLKPLRPCPEPQVHHSSQTSQRKSNRLATHVASWNSPPAKFTPLTSTSMGKSPFASTSTLTAPPKQKQISRLFC